VCCYARIPWLPLHILVKTPMYELHVRHTLTSYTRFGPLMGTLLAFGMYRIVKSVEYQTVNPGQDFDEHEAELFQPPEDPETAEQVERPNVAAAAMQDAIRMASRCSGDEMKGIETTMSQPRRMESREEMERRHLSEKETWENEMLEKSGYAPAVNGIPH
jgi:aquaporin related protein